MVGMLLASASSSLSFLTCEGVSRVGVLLLSSAIDAGPGFTSALFSLLPPEGLLAARCWTFPVWTGDAADLSETLDLRGETRPFYTSVSTAETWNMFQGADLPA